MENKHLLKNAMSFKKYIAILLLFLGVFSIPLYAARTYSGTERVYLKADAVSWWRNDNAKIGLYFSGGTGTATFVEATVFSGAVWSALAPAGNYDKINVTRHSGSPITWGNKWNQTGDIPISETSTHNYISAFAENSTTATWGSYVLSAPTANAASSISSTGFTANWTAVTGNEGYRLDVSTNNTFTENLTGYTNLTVTGTSQVVTGLTGGTNYYYRVRTFNAGGSSVQSNTITATTTAASTAPSITSSAATSVGNATGTMNGNISSNGGASITDYGFYWSTTNNFANGTGTKVQLGTSNYTGNISHQLTGLTNGTTYYYKAYAHNSVGTTYGSQQSFTPFIASAPSLTTTTCTYVSSSSFTVNGNISSNGGANITDYGFYYSTDYNFASSTKAQVGTSNTTGAITKTLTGLTDGTTYYYKAYATNSAGTTYGSVESFVLKSGTLSFATSCTYYFDNSQTQWSSVYLVIGHYGYLRSYQASLVSGSGNIYSVTVGSTWSDAKGWYFANGSGGSAITSGTSSYNINTLPASLPTPVTAKTAMSGTAGTCGYLFVPSAATPTLAAPGSWVAYPAKPSLTASAATSVGSSGATLNGNIAHNGGASITDYGFYYSTTNGFADGAGTKAQVGTSNTTGAISKVLSSLNGGTTYYYKAYATNSAGTSYTTQQSFTTTSSIPTLTSPTATSITATGATLGATVTADGGAALTSRGTVWGTGAAPTGNALAEGGTTVAAFSHARTGLTENTTYTYRGYAINSVGTSYSADGTFTTLPAAPTVGSGTSVAANSFTANWSHPSPQGSASYTYEVQVSTNNSTWASPINVTGIASSSTSTSITGLAAGTTYYYRVLARNATGAGAWSSSSAGIATTASCSAPADVTISGGATQCGGTVTLTASGGTGGTIYWQTASDGTSTANGSGTSKVVSATGTWYARSYNSADGGCWSNISNSQAVTINTIPAAPTTTDGGRCGTGTVTLSASQPSGANTNKWYEASEGGSALATATSYTTPSISSTTTYYVSSYNSTTTCESATRTAVTASVGSSPSPSSVITGKTTPLQGATETYSVTNEVGVSYAWTFPSGWTQASGGTTNSITVEVGSGSGSISVTPSVGGCSGIPRTLAVAPLAPPTPPTITSKTASVCDNDFTSFGSMYVSANGYLAGESFTGTYSYQWQKYNTGTSSWDNYTDGLGATTNNIRPPFSGQYRCIVTRNNVSVASNTVTLSAAGCSAKTVSSNLPVVIISTSGQGFPVKCSEFTNWSDCIPNPSNPTPSSDVKTKIQADIKILWDGTASDTDGLITHSDITNAAKLHYDRKARVNYRGSSSMNFTKKSYAIVTGEPNVKDTGEYKKGKTNLFNLSAGTHADWILYAAFADASMMRNKLALDMYADMIDLWTPQSRYVELYVDGEYKGVYVFMEKVEESSTRVNLGGSDYGYLFKFDKTEVFDRAEDRHASDPDQTDGTTFFTSKTGKKNIGTYNSVVDQAFEMEQFPGKAEIGDGSGSAEASLALIKAKLTAFETALAAGNFENVRQLIDYETWADWFIIAEFTKNPDAFRASTWFALNDIDAKVRAIPIWDYELGFNNNATNTNVGNFSTAGFFYNNSVQKSDAFPIPFWWEGGNNWSGSPKGLLDDPCFRSMIKSRWAIHTGAGGALSAAVIDPKIAAMHASLNQSNGTNTPIAREIAKNPLASRNQAGYKAQDAYATQKSTIETWITNRRSALNTLIVNLAGGIEVASAVGAHPTNSTYATYDYDPFVLTLNTEDTPIEWQLTQPTGVTDGYLIISADTKSATLIAPHHTDPYTLTASSQTSVCGEPAVLNYNVYVNETPAENCTASTPNCTSTWAYRFDSDATDGTGWNVFTNFTCTGNGVWTRTFVLPGDRYNWNFKIGYSSDSGVYYTQNQYTFNSKGITSYSGSKTWTIVLTEGASAGAFTFVILEGDHTSTSVPTVANALLGNIPVINNNNLEVTLNGLTGNTGCATITAYGFEYADNPSFTGATPLSTSGARTQGQTFSSTFNASGLTCGDTYYYRSFLTNSDGTDYSVTGTFEAPCEPCPKSSGVTYDQEVFINACDASKVIDLSAGLSGTIPVDAGTRTYTVVGDATGLSINGSNATFSGSASKDYLIQVEFSEGGYCAVKGTLSVSYTNNTPALGFTNTLTPSGLSHVTYPYEDFVLEATTLVPSNATIEWSLIRTGVTGGEITVSPNGKSVTFVTDQLASSPNKYTIRGTIPGVGTCAGVTADYDVYVNSESCAAANSSTVVRLTDPGNTYLTAGWNGSAYVYVHYIKKSDGVTQMTPLGAWPGKDFQVSNGYSSITIDGATFAEAQDGTVNVQFRSRYDYSGNTGKTESIPVTSGKIYTVSLTGSYLGSGTDRVFAHSVSSTANASAPIVSRGFAPHFNANELTLHGYLECENGSDVSAYGFQYATNAAFTNAVNVTTTGTIDEGTAYYKVVNVADLNCTTTYYYRAYATNGGGTAYSDASTFYVPASQYCLDCGSFEGETITFTIDSDFTADNDCVLRYRSLEGAVAKLKATPDFYDAATTELKKFIIMNVVPRTTPYAGTANPVFSGGGENIGSYTVHMIDDINDLDAVDYQYKYNGTVPRTLTIQSASATVKPSIKSIILRRVKNVRLSNLAILGTTTSTSKETNALDIDNGQILNGKGDWLGGVAGRYEDGNILVENCNITSKGFTCIHVSAYQGVTFRNNEIEAKLTDAELSVANTQKWGASAKFIRTTDILFERNNFRGDHATLVWLQESKNVLFMNNVFWATNNVNAQQAFIKLLSQEGDNTVENNAFYYNTLFLNNGTSNNTQIDFFRLGRADIVEQRANQDKYIASGIAFEYNNCYSYEPTVTGKRADTFLSRDAADFTLLKNNNFWSISGGTSSDGLEFGTGATNIHVKQELCSTAPNDPMGLVVKGADLNVGSALTTDITGLGAMSIHRKDRLHTAPIRPESGTGWTIGAYQQTDGIPVDTIIWTGAFDNDWDNRNNWIDAATRQTLSCVHQLSANLVVIIPSYTGSEIYQSPTGQIQHEPILPAQFASDRPIKLDNEHVDAGAGLTLFTPTQFARKIDIEYGGSLLNAHKLKPGEDRRYDEVTMHLDLNNRKEWVLVGPVVQPFTDGTKTAVRQLQSGDFFLNFEPHVYMNYVNIDTSTGAVTWAAPFTQLTEPVGPQQIFAIRVPDQYGNQKPLLFKKPAQFYYLDRFGGTAEQRALGTAPIKYTFNGRLSDEAGLRQYTIESAHQILSNTFPANLDAAKVAAAGGTVKVYDYDLKSFENALGGDMIKPMHGFIYSRSDAGQTSLQVTDAMIVFGNTKYRKRTVTQPLFRMNVNNTNNTYGSRINVLYDADKADTFDGMIDSERNFNDQDLNVPQMYMMAYSKKLSQKGINKQTEIIPLGIRTNVEKSLKFTPYYNDGYQEVFLEDRQTGISYDMLASSTEYIINNVPSGNNEGRFYLHLTVAEDRIPSTIGEETIGSSDAEELDIAIFAQGKQVTVSSSQNLVIETILVSDMAGRTQVFTASNPHFNQLNLQVAQGTYIVKVIGDKATKEAKVIIK